VPSILLSPVQPKNEMLPRKTRRGLGAQAMYRARLLWLLSAAVILGALRCSSSEPEPALAEGLANLRTAAQKATASSCNRCLDIHLGDYNLFLLEDFTYTGTIQGKLAVGGNVTLSGFSLGLAQPDNNVSNTLVAGGNLTLTDGAVAGAARYGGLYTPTRVSYSRGTAAQGTPIDFAARFAELRSLSSRLAAQSPQGTTQSNPWSVTMSGTDPCLNVFTLRASDFAGHGDWTLTAPASSFVLVNITGQAPAYSGGNIRLVGISPQRVLFNFVDATSLTAESFNFQGTVLAPRAHVTIRWTVFTGGLYANSLVLQGASANLSPLDEMAGAQTEVCNGADDNCNGQVDEGFECTGSGSRSCTAWCGAEGTQTCDSTTCGYGECTSASCCHADADCSSDSYCSGNTCVARQDNGASCGSSSQCASGQCVDGVCCNTACEGECNACNLAGYEGTCTLAPATTQCRSSAGACDVAEFCTGSSAACPADTKQPDTTVCRGSAGTCDVAEYCTGTGNDCPADGYASSATQCRVASGECDVAEFCTGSSASCPANGYQASGAECSSDGNACTSDVCDGAGGCGHPQLPAGTVCGSWQVCSSTGQCVNANECWIGGIQYAAGATNPNGPCQVCDPSRSASDWSFAPATTQCRGSAGVCDAAEYCTGSSAACPADTKQPATTVCRGSAGTCDVAEYCTGTGNDCPADGYASSATQCRAANGVCDVAEHCTGTAAACPGDAVANAGTLCRAAAGTCDVAEVCDGTQKSCPADGYSSPGTSCGTSYGSWSTCGGFSDFCSTRGTQSRTVTNSTCGGAGVCSASSTTTETQACTRPAPDTSCQAPSYGAWSACSFSTACAQTGSRSRTVTSYSYSCASGQCVASATTETETCTRNTNGNSCGPTTYGGWGSCSGFSDTCDETGTQSRTATEQICSSGQCMASTRTEFQGCVRSTAGVQCRAGNACDYAEYCSGGFCPPDSRVPAGTSCNDGDPGTIGDVCDGNGGCAGEAPSDCPSTTVTWSQPQPAWNGNGSTAGTYYCQGVINWASHGSNNVAATLISSNRTGSARFNCRDGNWVVSGASCDGSTISVSQAGGFAVTCFDPRPTYILWIGWYVAELGRCPDPDGLDWWARAYDASSNRDEAYWRNALREGGVPHGDVPVNGHVSPYIESRLCGSLAYPWANIRSFGESCKYRP
jgi:choice-of-anchor A domain-containing protein